MGSLLANQTGYGERLGLVRIAVSQLQPGSKLTIHLYASNSKGRSGVVRMESFTLDQAYTKGVPVYEPPPQFSFQEVPGLGVLFVSLTVTILLLVFGLFAASAYRRRHVTHRRILQKGSVERQNHQIQDVSRERSPDIIKDTPGENGSAHQKVTHQVNQTAQSHNRKGINSPTEGGFNSTQPDWSGNGGGEYSYRTQHYNNKFSDSGGYEECENEELDWSQNSRGLHEESDARLLQYQNNQSGLQLGLQLCTTGVHNVQRISLRAPLLDDDRESCV